MTPVRMWLAAFLVAASPASALAQDGPSFKGKTVDIYTGYTVGGGYDLYTRLLARHFGKHLSGDPSVVPKNMEGAASIRLANWLYTPHPRTAPPSAPSAAAPRSIPCSASPAPSSTAPGSTGSAAPTTK